MNGCLVSAACVSSRKTAHTRLEETYSQKQGYPTRTQLIPGTKQNTNVKTYKPCLGISLAGFNSNLTRKRALTATLRTTCQSAQDALESPSRALQYPPSFSTHKKREMGKNKFHKGEIDGGKRLTNARRSLYSGQSPLVTPIHGGIQAKQRNE